MLKTAVELPETVYRKMNYIWSLFFLSLAALNLFVAYTYPTDTWVNFKVFGLIGLTVVFVIGQSVWLARYMKTAE
jgi:intracellular septation protein